MPERARHVWHLILEHQKDPRSRRWNGDWFDLKKRIKAEGWTNSVLRDFSRISQPRLDIRPPLGLENSKPPTVPWRDIRLSELGKFEVKFLERHGEDLEVSDALLPRVFGILENQLTIACGLLADIETVYFQTPTCYPEREFDGEEHITDATGVMAWFVQQFDRMAEFRPELAKAHATTWPVTDQYFFHKLKLYAFSKRVVFDANPVAKVILSFNQQTFWNLDAARELLFLLVDRWAEFSQEHRDQLLARILAGPDQLAHWSDAEYPGIRDEFVARYSRYLELQGCCLTADQSTRIVAIIQRIPNWSDGRATSTVIKRGSHAGWVGTDESPDAIIDLSDGEVVARAREDLKRDFGSFTEKRSFTGLVKANPRKALSALKIAGRDGDYPEAFWSSMINELPSDIEPRLRRIFLIRLTKLPLRVIEELRHTLGRWLEQKLVATLEFDDALGWAVYDHTVDGILSGGAAAAASGLGEVHQGGEVVERSRRTYGHAIAGPLGMCAEALYHAVPGEKQEASSTVPDYIRNRIERLFAARGEGSDHAVSITTSKLNWLMYIDPNWTRRRIVPMLAFDHPASEPAWNGLLSSRSVPRPPLLELIKPLMLELFPWIEGFSWDQDLSKVAASWLGFMRIFQPDQPSGLTKREMRMALRSMSDESRTQFIFWLGQVGQKNGHGWSKLVEPFINEVWPRERRYRTSASMRAWIGLLDDTSDSFPAVYNAVKKFLVAVEANDHPFYRFTRELDDEEPITTRFPGAVVCRTVPSAAPVRVERAARFGAAGASGTAVIAD